MAAHGLVGWRAVVARGQRSSDRSVDAFARIERCGLRTEQRGRLVVVPGRGPIVDAAEPCVPKVRWTACLASASDGLRLRSGRDTAFFERFGVVEVRFR